MKPFVVLALAIVLLALASSPTPAADLARGQVSPSTLNAMGLGGSQPLSDTQGELVRGKGFFYPVYAVNYASINVIQLGGFKFSQSASVSVNQNIHIGGR